MTPTLDLAALRATAEIQKLSSDKLFAGFERGEEWIDQGDERARELAYGVLALLDRLEAAEAVCKAAEFVRHASDCPQISWAHLVLEGHRGDEKPPCTCWRHDIETTLDAWLALRGSSDSGTGDEHG